MSRTTWTHLEGDTSVFAFEVAFHPDEQSRNVTEEERASWGSFALYVRGQNLCAQLHESETLQRVHWYLLPLFEWLAGHWDALFHEELLPEPALVPSAGEFDRWAARQDLASDDPERRLDAWQQWMQRHSLQMALPGAVVPDVYLRRCRHQLEVSMGAAPTAGEPQPVQPMQREVVEYVPLEQAAVATYETLALAVERLHHNMPASKRLKQLLEQVLELSTPGPSRLRAQLGHLVGQPNGSAEELVENAELTEYETVGATPLVIAEAPAPALLFGSYSPHLVHDDLEQLKRFLARSAQPLVAAQALYKLQEQLQPVVNQDPLAHPGEQGGWCGDALYEPSPRGTQQAQATDVDEWLAQLGIGVESVFLSDRTVRGLSIVGRSHAPLIGVNDNYERGVRDAVRRFTIAHEVGHLLLDAGRGREWGVTSGPWAPLRVEQRANGFAAALLMPAPVLHQVAEQAHGRLADIEFLPGVAEHLRVSLSSLLDRLLNLQLLAPAEAERVRDELASY